MSGLSKEVIAFLEQEERRFAASWAAKPEEVAPPNGNVYTNVERKLVVDPEKQRFTITVGNASFEFELDTKLNVSSLIFPTEFEVTKKWLHDLAFSQLPSTISHRTRRHLQEEHMPKATASLFMYQGDTLTFNLGKEDEKDAYTAHMYNFQNPERISDSIQTVGYAVPDTLGENTLYIAMVDNRRHMSSQQEMKLSLMRNDDRLWTDHTLALALSYHKNAPDARAVARHAQVFHGALHQAITRTV